MGNKIVIGLHAHTVFLADSVIKTYENCYMDFYTFQSEYRKHPYCFLWIDVIVSLINTYRIIVPVT